MNIEIIITWWTIDSFFDPTVDKVIPLKKTCVPDYISSLKTNYEFIYTNICMKDSREIKIQDLQKIVTRIEESKNEYFIITHWTYTMPDTARYLESHIKATNKKVILIWSMIPLTWFSPSDAGFNIGYAFAKLEHINPWVYVWMNGNIFWAQEVSKLISDWKFVSLFNS